MSYRTTAFSIFALAGLVTVQSARPATVSFTPLPFGRANGVNNAAQVAGGTIGGEDVIGLVFINGNIVRIQVPNSVQTNVNGINNNGQIVGSYYTSENHGTSGFLFFQGNTTVIQFPAPNVSTVCERINDAQQIVGYFTDPAGVNHAFLFDSGTYTQIDVPDASSTIAYGINSSGEIVGAYIDSSGHQHGFLFSRDTGSFSTIDVPFEGATETTVFGINGSSTIVGSYVDSAGTHGFVDIGGVFTGIDAPETPGTIGTYLRGISDNNLLAIFGNGGFLGTLSPGSSGSRSAAKPTASTVRRTAPALLSRNSASHPR